MRGKEMALLSSAEATPFIDKQGLLRVGGRLKSATSPYSMKHPIIIPKKSHVPHTPVPSWEAASPGLRHNSQRNPPSWILHHQWPFINL